MFTCYTWPVRFGSPRSLMLALSASLLGCPSSQPSTETGAHAGVDSSNAQPAAVRTVVEIRKAGNRLRGEPSPYLEQHAHNPVDWYPWGEEALTRARREGKPIFLSVGYSTCHWCHVMEEESFEDDEVAEFLNRHFICIKVDREQRPDVDALYMEAVATLGAQTGWPLTVFLTPRLEPFYGGTYFPRTSSGGRPGFLDVLGEVHMSWREQGEAVSTRGRAVLERIEARALERVRGAGRVEVGTLDDAMVSLARVRDLVRGGFGTRQKFPNAPLLLAQLRHAIRSGDTDAREHLVVTLESMMHGGIRDHLQGSFHRYTVDPRWHVPHFEKTLYDNAQLVGLFVEAGLAFQRPDFVEVGRAAADDLVARWQGPDGGFIVGFDADDPAGEGVYYTWTPSELDQALGERDGPVLAAAFGVSNRGEATLDGRSVLHRRADPDVAAALGVSEAELRTTVERSLPVLARARARRPAPAVDDKAIVAWNGLAVIALADAGRWLDEPRYVDAAERAATWILRMRDDRGRLLRGSRQGRPLGEAFLDDHALAGLGLVRLHAATGDERWLEAAHSLVDEIVQHHYEVESGVLSRTRRSAQDLPIRLVDFDDGPLPSGGSAALLLVLELGALSGDATLLAIGQRILERVATSVRDHPSSSGFLLVALDHATAPVREVVVAGGVDDPDTVALWAVLRPTTHARVLPIRIGATGPSAALHDSFPALRGKQALRGKATAFVCERGSCQAPASDPAVLRNQLRAALDSVR